MATLVSDTSKSMVVVEELKTRVNHVVYPWPRVIEDLG